jgi:hypothetical protein
MEWNIQSIPLFDHMFMDNIIQYHIPQLEDAQHVVHTLIHISNHQLIYIYKTNHIVNVFDELQNITWTYFQN